MNSTAVAMLCDGEAHKCCVLALESRNRLDLNRWKLTRIEHDLIKCNVVDSGAVPCEVQSPELQNVLSAIVVGSVKLRNKL